MKHKVQSFFGGLGIGSLGGLIGLGGAEFRLPFLVGVLRFETLDAIVINLITSLVTVSFALLFRGVDATFFEHSYIVINLLAGTLIGAFIGAHYASTISKELLHKAIFWLLLFLAFLLASHPFLEIEQLFHLSQYSQIILGFLLGIGVGVVSSLLGVAGGELLIPLIVLLYGVDIKLAGTLSLAISAPTLMVGLYKYYQRKALARVVEFKESILLLSLGSIVGAFIGALLYGVFHTTLITLVLSAILFVSAYKLFKKSELKA